MSGQGPQNEQISNVDPAPNYTVVKNLVENLFLDDTGGRNSGVWVVRRVRDGKTCVRKDMPISNPLRLNIARKEIAITRALRHPNVIGFIEACCEEAPMPRKNASLYVELCDLGSLAGPIRMHKTFGDFFPEAFLRHVMFEVSAGLAYLHEGVPRAQFGTTTTTAEMVPGWKPVIHSDLKPQNIFMASDPEGGYPRLVIADFGWAIRSDDERYHGELMGGSMAVWAPEWPFFVEASDVWALGAVLQNACLFDGGPLRRAPAFVDRGSWAQRPESWNPRGAGRMYTKALNDMIGQCQIMDPTKRPRAQDLGVLMQSAFSTTPVPTVPLFTARMTKSELEDLDDQLEYMVDDGESWE